SIWQLDMQRSRTKLLAEAIGRLASALILVQSKVDAVERAQALQFVVRWSASRESDTGYAPHPQREQVKRPLNETHTAQVTCGLIPPEKWFRTGQSQIFRLGGGIAAHRRLEEPADQPDGPPGAQLRHGDPSGHKLATVLPHQANTHGRRNRKPTPLQITD